VLTWKRLLLLSALAGVALAAPARSQTFGLGATYGSVNDISHTFNFDGFKPSEYTVFFDYKLEHATLLRLTYGSMWTEQALSGSTVTTPDGPLFIPSAKERINYLTADTSYQYAEGFYTGGIFGGIGGYSFKPEPMPEGFAQYQDLEARVFGFNLGIDGEFRVTTNLAIVLRMTYHNVAAHPHRQFLNADAGLVARF
jgi:hypothetical protein